MSRFDYWRYFNQPYGSLTRIYEWQTTNICNLVNEGKKVVYREMKVVAFLPINYVKTVEYLFSEIMQKIIIHTCFLCIPSTTVIYTCAVLSRDMYFCWRLKGCCLVFFWRQEKLRILMYELCVQLPLLSTYMNWLHTKHFLAFFVK